MTCGFDPPIWRLKRRTMFRKVHIPLSQIVQLFNLKYFSNIFVIWICFSEKSPHIFSSHLEGDNNSKEESTIFMIHFITIPLSLSHNAFLPELSEGSSSSKMSFYHALLLWMNETKPHSLYHPTWYLLHRKCVSWSSIVTWKISSLIIHLSSLSCKKNSTAMSTTAESQSTNKNQHKNSTKNKKTDILAADYNTQQPHTWNSTTIKLDIMTVLGKYNNLINSTTVNCRTVTPRQHQLTDQLTKSTEKASIPDQPTGSTAETQIFPRATHDQTTWLPPKQHQNQ